MVASLPVLISTAANMFPHSITAPFFFFFGRSLVSVAIFKKKKKNIPGLLDVVADFVLQVKTDKSDAGFFPPDGREGVSWQPRQRLMIEDRLFYSFEPF